MVFPVAILKKPHSGILLDKIGDTEATFDEILKQATMLIASCYGFKEENDLPSCRIRSWFFKNWESKKGCS